MVTFYDNGLQFGCTRCSYCCRYTPGYVFLSHNDLQKLVTSFKTSESEFIEKYCRFVDMNGKTKLSFIETDKYDCIFWAKSGCEIYEARPIQCRSYPFWNTHLFSHRDWADLGFSCPGVGKGTTHSKAEIDEWLATIAKEVYDFSDYQSVNGKRE